MSRQVAIHAIDPNELHALVIQSEARIEGDLSDLRETPSPASRLSFMVDAAFSVAQFGVVAAIDHARILRGLRVAAQATVALFDLAAHHDEHVAATIDGHAFDLYLPSAHGMAGATAWHNGFFAACACRDEAARVSLASIDDTTLAYARPSTQTDEYQYALVGALAALSRSESNAGARLAATRALAHPERVKVSEGDVLARHAARIELAQRLHEGDAARFNEALEAALVAHRGYWTKTKERRDDPRGFLALDALGLACLARERGMAIDVESDYIPAWIVRGER